LLTTYKEITISKGSLLIYSIYLILGSVALFVSLSNIYTTIQAVIWKYSEKYVVYSSSVVFFSFIAGLLLLLASYRVVNKDAKGYIIGFTGCVVLIVYISYIMVMDFLMPYSFIYLLVLFTPGLILCVLSLIWWRRS